MPFRHKRHVVISIGAVLAAGAIWAASSAGASSGAPTKYEKCRLKCLKHYDACVENAKDSHDRDRRIEKKADCDLHKRKCVAKCDDE
jgi:hypothetical protein